MRLSARKAHPAFRSTPSHSHDVHLPSTLLCLGRQTLDWAASQLFGPHGFVSRVAGRRVMYVALAFIAILYC